MLYRRNRWRPIALRVGVYQEPYDDSEFGYLSKSFDSSSDAEYCAWLREGMPGSSNSSLPEVTQPVGPASVELLSQSMLPEAPTDAFVGDADS